MSNAKGICLANNCWTSTEFLGQYCQYCLPKPDPFQEIDRTIESVELMSDAELMSDGGPFQSRVLGALNAIRDYLKESAK